MPLTLIFSRNRNNDDSVRFLDNPVDDPSIMVDTLSILSQFRRTAGWLYPIRQVSNLDFERGRGQLLLFGKQRCIFTDFPPPYFLEFFPKFGVGAYILSVYTGEFSVSGSPGWVNIPGGGWYVNYYPDERVIRARLGDEGAPVYDFKANVSEAVVFGGGLFFAFVDGTYEKWLPYTAGSGGISVQEYDLIKSSQGTIILS